MKLFYWEFYKTAKLSYKYIFIILIFMFSFLFYFNELRLSIPENMNINEYNEFLNQFEGVTDAESLKIKLANSILNMDDNIYILFQESLDTYFDKQEVDTQLVSKEKPIIAFYNNLGAEKLINFLTTTRSSMLISIFIVLLSSISFSEEFEQNMNPTILSSVRGRLNFIMAKILSICLFSIIVFTLYYFLNILVCLFLFKCNEQLSHPIQSIVKYVNSPFEWSIFKLLIVNYTFSLLHIIFIVHILSLISAIAKKNIVSVSISFILLIFPFMLNPNKKILKIITALFPIISLTGTEMYGNNFGFLVGTRYIYIYQLIAVIEIISIVLIYPMIQSAIKIEKGR